MADLAIEETNRIRASLGMKPLPVPSSSRSNGPNFKPPPPPPSDSDLSSDSESDGEKASTLETRAAQGYDNWKKYEDEAAAKRKREAKATAIKKARDAAARFAKLEGKGLGDENVGVGDGDGGGEGASLDTKTWLVQQKKRRKKIEKERLKAERLERELEERERAIEYSEKDLKGVNVAHAAEEFEGAEGDGQILTLMDQTIDQNEEEGDELENFEMREKEKLDERLGAKKKGRVAYDPTAEDGGERKILGQYDEEIEGKKRKRFQLEGGEGMSAEAREAKKREVGEKLKKQMISLDVGKVEVPASDYAEAKELKVRKPKKAKKEKKTRRKGADEDDIFPVEEVNGTHANGDSMEVDGGFAQVAKPAPQAETAFDDDDDLQAALAIQRRAALKKRKKAKPADIARQLREEELAAADTMDDAPEEAGGLVIDETTEFVASLQRAKESDERLPPKKARSSTPQTKQEARSPDVHMRDIPSSDEEFDDTESTTIKKEDPDSSKLTETGLMEEQTMSSGLGSTLSMLRDRGLVKVADSATLVNQQRGQAAFLQAKRARESDIERKARQQRERDRASGKWEHMSAREREDHARRENQARDQAESRAMAEVFNREYRPNVELKYVDEFGRRMDQKEAFKHLSHQFHGKGSGKQKTEKLLKKVEEEKREQEKSLLDARREGGMQGAAGSMGKRNREAGVRLA